MLHPAAMIYMDINEQPGRVLAETSLVVRLDYLSATGPIWQQERRQQQELQLWGKLLRKPWLCGASWRGALWQWKQP
jgi:hypothetical protein